MPKPFWKEKPLEALSPAEWESLCDGCGKCCLHKLEDEDTGRVHLTAVACRLLDLESGRCRHYATRARRVAACVRIRPDNVRSLALPATCAYRRLAEGKPLPPWHPLRTGDAGSTRAAGASVQGWAVSERDVSDADLPNFVISARTLARRAGRR